MLTLAPLTLLHNHAHVTYKYDYTTLESGFPLISPWFSISSPHRLPPESFGQSLPELLFILSSASSRRNSEFHQQPPHAFPSLSKSGLWSEEEMRVGSTVF
ncbi:hypothetical protein C5167_048798 [Papaver somniferum]|uniref:Uncharacterized protein n=1 Tax=Papaver somniferum TaxID=3469 RepID=A0A4Y7KN51_PAPSO|nr:hypothetical protein C5167_048798 [Papaver somniferum]